jgi:hypothetical protein
MALCAALTLAGVFPVGVLVGMLVRFPVPFRGYVNMWGVLREAPVTVFLLPLWLVEAVAFYVALGGFLVLIPLGLVGGLVGSRAARSHPERRRRYLLGIALGIDLVVVGVLSVLDLIIGPW